MFPNIQLFFKFEKEISSLTTTDCEQDQEKTQCRHPTCPPEISDIPRAPTCKLAKLIREILEENLEKELSSLTISDCEQDQEKTQGQRPTCPPGFSDIPQAQKNIRGLKKTNLREKR